MGDTIDRQAAIDALIGDGPPEVNYGFYFADKIKELPSEQPEIVYCKDCIKHNKGLQDVIFKESACPLVEYRGKAQGHEFDYQFCACGIRERIVGYIKQHQSSSG